MFFNFAWRYFRAKKSANAINIIAWVTVAVIAFATCCQVLVLSVFNGFEGLVKSLYSSFYADIKIKPAAGKTFLIDSALVQKIQQNAGVAAVSMIVEERALLKNGEEQTLVMMKGVDGNYKHVSGLAGKIVNGKYDIGTADNPGIIIGMGIQNAASINVDTIFAPDNVTLILPKKSLNSSDPIEALSEGNVIAKGVFAIQQDFDNQYAITNLDFLKQQMAFQPREFSSIEIKLKNGIKEKDVVSSLAKVLGDKFIVQNRYQQNSGLYATMQLEKWAIYAVLTLILIIAAFNMISALTMLVLEKKTDISILQSLGTSKSGIQKIFLAEGLLLGIIGASAGIILALLICFLQVKYKLVKLTGGSFLIDYFPVKVNVFDIVLVAVTAIVISFIAAWFPSFKASKQEIELK